MLYIVVFFIDYFFMCLYFFYYFFIVFCVFVGEIHIKNPEKCRDIKIATTCYDKDNHIIDARCSVINTKLFLGFDTLHVVISGVVVDDIKRIRLYPTFFLMDK